MAVLSWSAAHWFELLQSIGIVFGLLFTAFALRADERVKRVQTLFTITEHHRDLWTQLYSRPELARVGAAEPDLEKHPVTTDEELFINLLILHTFAAYRAALAKIYVSPQNLSHDIGGFFSLPIPQSVWNRLKQTQGRDFVSFVEKSIQDFKADRIPGAE